MDPRVAHGTTNPERKFIPNTILEEDGASMLMHSNFTAKVSLPSVNFWTALRRLCQ
jgi:hypothetical protein